jgi:hypothetical protein
MKKLWIIFVSAIMAISLTACGAGNVDASSSKGLLPQTSSQTASSQSSSSQAASLPIRVKESSVSDDFAGLQKYLAGNASVTGTPEEMRKDMIGAKSGVRYKYGYNGKDNVMLELYEFDLSNLNATAQKVISEVKSSGKFTMIDQPVNAILSKNGKYLMVYKNTSTDDANKAYDVQVKKLFTDFKAE